MVVQPLLWLGLPGIRSGDSESWPVPLAGATGAAVAAADWGAGAAAADCGATVAVAGGAAAAAAVGTSAGFATGVAAGVGAWVHATPSTVTTWAPSAATRNRRRELIRPSCMVRSFPAVARGENPITMSS